MNIVFPMGKTMILGLFRQWSIMHIRRVHAKIPSRHWYSINSNFLFMRLFSPAIWIHK